MNPILLLLLVVLAACGGAPSSVNSIGHASAPVSFDLGQLGEVPEFHLLERAGKPLGLADLKGKVWVAMFIFSRCQGPCVAMCMEMSRLQDEFLEEPDFVTVATTVDPAYDTPEVLRKHADRFEALPDRWYFLTGTRELIRDFAVEGLKVPWREEDPLTHSERFVLVDRTGQIRGFYQLTETGRMKKLREDVRAVLDGK